MRKLFILAGLFLFLLTGVAWSSDVVAIGKLMWQQIDDGVTRTWSNSKDYCDALSLGGYNDWRLPTKNELKGIVYCSNGKAVPLYDWDYNLTNDENLNLASCGGSEWDSYSEPTIISSLSCTINDQYYGYRMNWSSTIYNCNSTGCAWFTGFSNNGGVTNYTQIDSKVAVRCVRDATPIEPPKIYGLFVGMDYSDDDGNLVGGDFKDGPDGKTWATKFYDYYRGHPDWSEKNIDSLLILNPDEEEDWVNKLKIQNAIKKVEESGLTEGDIFIFYFLGHGLTMTPDSTYYMDETSTTKTDEFIVLYGDNETLNGTIRDDELMSYFNTSLWNKVNKIFIITSCHSGGFWGNNGTDEGDLEKLDKIYFYAAAKENAKSYGTDGQPFYDDLLLKGLKKYGHPVPFYALSNDAVKEHVGEVVDVYGLDTSGGESVFQLDDWQPIVEKTDDISIEIKPFSFPWPMFLPAISNSRRGFKRRNSAMY